MTSWAETLFNIIVCRQFHTFLSFLFSNQKMNENPRRTNVYFPMKLKMFFINSTQSDIINYLIDFSL